MEKSKSSDNQIEFTLPKGRNWELVVDEEGEIKCLSIDDKGEIDFEAPFLWKCHGCKEVISTPTPEKPKFCRTCDAKHFIQGFPDEFKSLYGSKWHIPWMLPPKPQETDPLVLYTEIRDCVAKHVVFPKEEHYDMLTLWIMASWKIDNFIYCPYLLFRGEIESGKTRALDVIGRLAYHAIETVGLTPAVLRKQVDWFRCTSVIDQTEDQLNRKYEAGQDMYRLVAAGYKKGMYVARCREGNPKKIDYDDPFGFKAFASTKSFDAAIDSRSIIIDMEEAEPELLDIEEGWCQKLRAKLLHWRLCQHNLSPIVNTVLRGRTRELFMSLLAVAELTDAKGKIEKFALVHQKARRMELLDEIKASIIEIIENLVPSAEEGRVYISQIKDVFEERGVTNISSSYIGKRLSDLDIPRLSSRKGRYIDLLDPHNIKKLEYWLKKYGLQKEDETKDGEGVKVGEVKNSSPHTPSLDEISKENA